jgi:mitochondrial transcription factor 1
VWSRHLHDALKPRRHVLVEPERDTLGKTLDSLLKQGKQYVHTDTVTEALDPANHLLSSEALASSNQGYTKQNPSLLISVNLSGPGLTTNRYIGPAAGYFFNNLHASLFGLREDLYRYGLVRVLAWVPQDASSALLPRGVNSRSKASLRLEAAFSMNQIVGLSQAETHSRDRRWHDLDMQNLRELRPHSNHLPPNRKDEQPLPFLSSLEPKPEVWRSAQFTTDAKFIDEWLALDEKIMSTDPAWLANRVFEYVPRRTKDKQDGPEKMRWRRLYTRAKSAHTRHKKVAAVVHWQQDLEDRWRTHLHAGEADTSLVESFQDEAHQVKAAIDALSSDARIQTRKTIDDYRAYKSVPRALEWNRRTFDPLVVQPDEFSPARPLTLIDITPDSNFRRLLDTDSKVTCFDYVVSRLASRWIDSAHDALNHLLQGGVDEFVERVPSLKDPRKGGWFDLTDLRMRSIPTTILIDIALAYEKWPLRPDTTKMMFELSRDTVFEPKDD